MFEDRRFAFLPGEDDRPFILMTIDEKFPEGLVGETIWLDHDRTDGLSDYGSVWRMEADGCWHCQDDLGRASYREMVKRYYSRQAADRRAECRI